MQMLYKKNIRKRYSLACKLLIEIDYFLLFKTVGNLYEFLQLLFMNLFILTFYKERICFYYRQTTHSEKSSIYTIVN